MNKKIYFVNETSQLNYDRCWEKLFRANLEGVCVPIPTTVITSCFRFLEKINFYRFAIRLNSFSPLLETIATKLDSLQEYSTRIRTDQILVWADTGQFSHFFIGQGEVYLLDVLYHLFCHFGFRYFSIYISVYLGIHFGINFGILMDTFWYVVSSHL